MASAVITAVFRGQGINSEPPGLDLGCPQESDSLSSESPLIWTGEQGQHFSWGTAGPGI